MLDKQPQKIEEKKPSNKALDYSQNERKATKLESS